MYDMCLFTCSDRLTFWSKDNPKGGSKCLILILAKTNT